MKKYLRFEKGKNPGDAIPVCTCGVAHFASEKICRKCGLKYASDYTPEYAVRQVIMALESPDPDENGNINQTFGQAFLDMLKKSTGEE